MIYIRELRESDVSFIYNSYLKSLRPNKSNITNTLYFKYEHDRLKSLVLHGSTLVLVNEEDHDQILGWLNSYIDLTNLIINYVYIKHSFRGQGFADLLVKTVIDKCSNGKNIQYSIQTRSGLGLVNKYNLQFNPYIIDLISQKGDIQHV